VVRDTIYVYGGSTYIGGGLTTVNEYYVPANNTWGTKTNMLSARYCHAGFCYSDQAYALGGYDYYNYLTLCQVFNPVSNSWSSDTPMQFARQSLPVAVVGNCVYAIAGWNNGAVSYTEEGLIQTGVEEHADAVHKFKLNISPNPFSEAVNIQFAIRYSPPPFPSPLEGEDKGEGDYALKIYDATGRMVKSIELPATYYLLPTAVTWSGDDDAGNKLPSGTYFIELSTVNGKVTEKVMLLR